MVSLALWMEEERGRFILWLPVAMGAAILIYFNLSSEPPLWLGFVLSGSSFVAMVACWRIPPARFAAALLLAASLGFARAASTTASEPPLTTLPYGAVLVAGRIENIDQLAKGQRVTLQPVTLNNTKIQRAIRVRLSNADTTVLIPGEEISLRALLFKPDRPAYPGGWDSGRDAFFSGLGGSGFALGDVTIISGPKDASSFSLVADVADRTELPAKSWQYCRSTRAPSRSPYLQVFSGKCRL